MTDAIRDNNHVPVALGVSSNDENTTTPFTVDPATGRLLVSTEGVAVTVDTTNNSATTLAIIEIPTDTTVMVEVRVVARRTGGTAGTAQDGAAYIVAGAYKNVAGTATEIGEGSIFSAEDQAGWTCTLTPSSGNVLVQVTGATDNNVSLSGTYNLYHVS